MNKFSIGKSLNNDIVIPNDLTVSRAHAELVIGEENFIVDLNSTNGTFVNGVKIIDKQKLNTLDVIRIGNSLVDWSTYTKDKTMINHGLDTTIIDDKEEFLVVEPKEIENTNVEKVEFYWGGFILGFLLNLIGVILAYIFSRDSNFRNSVWQGLLARIIVAFILLA